MKEFFNNGYVSSILGALIVALILFLVNRFKNRKKLNVAIHFRNVLWVSTTKPTSAKSTDGVYFDCFILMYCSFQNVGSGLISGKFLNVQANYRNGGWTRINFLNDISKFDRMAEDPENKEKNMPLLSINNLVRRKLDLSSDRDLTGYLLFEYNHMAREDNETLIDLEFEIVDAAKKRFVHKTTLKDVPSIYEAKTFPQPS
jgi:hypothetical protein